MSRTCDRVFRHSAARSKKARHKIHSLSWRRNDYREGIQGRDCFEVRPQILNIRFAFEYGQNVAGKIGLARLGPECRCQSTRDFGALARTRREVEAERLTLALHM